MRERTLFLTIIISAIIAPHIYFIYLLSLHAEPDQAFIYDGRRVKLIADDANGNVILRIDGKDSYLLDSYGIRVKREGSPSITLPSQSLARAHGE